jgi:hypothetical protein
MEKRQNILKLHHDFWDALYKYNPISSLSATVHANSLGLVTDKDAIINAKAFDSTYFKDEWITDGFTMCKQHFLRGISYRNTA